MSSVNPWDSASRASSRSSSIMAIPDVPNYYYAPSGASDVTIRGPSRRHDHAYGPRAMVTHGAFDTASLMSSQNSGVPHVDRASATVSYTGSGRYNSSSHVSHPRGWSTYQSPTVQSIHEESDFNESSASRPRRLHRDRRSSTFSSILSLGSGISDRSNTTLRPPICFRERSRDVRSRNSLFGGIVRDSDNCREERHDSHHSHSGGYGHAGHHQGRRREGNGFEDYNESYHGIEQGHPGHFVSQEWDREITRPVRRRRRQHHQRHTY